MSYKATSPFKDVTYQLEKIPVRYIAQIPEPSLLGDFVIRPLEALLDGQDMVQQIHRHDFFYLLILENASGSHGIDFTPYPVDGNTVFFMRPGQVHQLHLGADSKGYLLQFSSTFYYPQDKGSLLLLRKATIQNYYQLKEESATRVKSTLAIIWEELLSKKESYHLVVKANMDVLFIELIRNQRSEIAARNLHIQEKFDKLSQLLEENILKHKKVSEYAQLMALSVYQLNSITKAAVNKTCSEVINDHLILEAKRCILATSNQVSQTAYRLGFEDVSYFIRFFKKHTGNTPEAFRQNFK